MSRSVRYGASPLLASPTPVWRSKFIVAAIALGFAVLAGRAAYVQVLGNEFYQRQGEVRFARTLELPASRGRIMDRHGLVLAYNVPAPSIWAIPEDVNATPAQLAQLARLMEVPLPELQKKLADEDKTFVWLKRQVSEPVARQIAEMGIKGIYERKGYKRQYPDAVSSKTAWAAWSKTCASRCPRSMAKTCSCPLTRRCSFLPTKSCATPSLSTKPRRAAWWCSTRKAARCWPWPITPATRLTNG